MAELFATCLLFDYPAVKLSFLDLVKLRMKNEMMSIEKIDLTNIFKYILILKGNKMLIFQSIQMLNNK
jgi:hypothetical protein